MSILVAEEKEIDNEYCGLPVATFLRESKIDSNYYHHTVSAYIPNIKQIPTEWYTNSLASNYSQEGKTSGFFISDNGKGYISFAYVKQALAIKACFLTEKDAEQFSKLLSNLERIEPTQDQIEINFLYASDQSLNPTIISKQLAAPKFENIKINYKVNIQNELERLVNLTPIELTNLGRLILWRGVAGTGKTYMIRALNYAWRDWCSSYYVTDPNILFNSGSYIMNTIQLVGNRNRTLGTKAKDWNLLILEDCGELIAKDAKHVTGQGISKLLNITDGILGQGLNLIILMTTNEDVEQLHPAIKRNGRCLSNIEFDSFTTKEAETWLQAKGCNSRFYNKATLADLYAALNDSTFTPIEKQETKIGF